MNFAKLLRMPFFIEHVLWLFLYSKSTVKGSTEKDSVKSRGSRPDMFCWKGVVKVFAIYTRKYQRWSLLKTKLQVFSLKLYHKRDSHTHVFQCILQSFRTRFFKYSFGWLLLIDSWISLKVAPIAIAINVSKDSYQREFVFFFLLEICLQQIRGNF